MFGHWLEGKDVEEMLQGKGERMLMGDLGGRMEKHTVYFKVLYLGIQSES